MTRRNELCPCGSGKKYKACCLRRDQDLRVDRERHALEQKEQQRLEAERQRAESWKVEAKRQPALTEPQLEEEHSALAEVPLERPDDVLEELFAEFEEQDFTGQVELFQKTLDDPQLMDSETAFHMLSTIHQSAAAAHNRNKFGELVNALRARLPDVYESDKSYYLQMQIEDAVVEQRQQTVNSLVRELAATAEDDPDTFFRTLKCLAYHGQLSALVDATGIAWPLVEDSPELLDPDEVARQGADFVVYECLERNPQLDGRDAEMTTRARYFCPDLDVELLERFVGRLTGRLTGDWCLEDFMQRSASSRKKKKKSPNEEGRKNLYELGTEFVGYLGRQEKIPFTKARLAADNLVDYILQRLDGKLKDQFGPSPQVHPLCPDRATLDCYFGGMLRFLNQDSYGVAATFELLPFWLTFLERRGLINADDRLAAFDDLQELKDTLIELWSTDFEDPTLATNLRSWPEIGSPVLAKS